MSDVIFAITPITINWMVYALIAPAALSFIGGLVIYFKPQAGKKKSISSLIIYMIVAAGILSGGYLAQNYINTPATVEIGNNFIQLNSHQTGRINITSSQISNAYVIKNGTGGYTLSKISGEDDGIYLQIGVFLFENLTTGSFAKAYVVSNNPTDLIIQLTSGKYVILGNDDFTQLVAVFSQEVFPVSSIT